MAQLASGNNMQTAISKKFSSSPKLESCTYELAQAAKILSNILDKKSKYTEANTIEPYNHLSLYLDSAMAKARLYAQVHPDEKVRTEAENCEQELSSFITEMSLNHDLYDAFVQIDINHVEAESKRMLDKTLQDFRRSGVDKDTNTREHIKKLNEELVVIGQDFSRNIREDVRYIKFNSKADLAGLPKDYIDSRTVGENGKIKITTDYPDYILFMMYAKNGKLRKEIWKKALNRGEPKNKAMLNKMIKKRHELARVLGYESYAAYVLEDKMIKTPARAQDFINDVTKTAQKRANVEYEELLAEKRKDDAQATEIMGYEKSFYEERVKKDKFSFDSKALRPYFQFERVLEGVLELTSQLFDIRYERVRDADIWHSSVAVYDAYEGRNILGRIFLDLHPRDNKYKHAAQFVVKSGVLGKQLPQGALICNFPDPTKSKGPALMDHDQVVTLFHEFGHLLHHVFGGNQKWIRFSGVATEWDFVEAPSQMLEEWAWDAQVLQKMARHHAIGKPISLTLIQRMRDANEFGKGLNTLQQMFYASLSLQYYHKSPESFNAHELLKSLQAKYSKFPHEEGTHFNLNFGHLDGYSAMYYTYMWSQVIAKDLLSPFKKDGMLNQEHALNYKNKILRAGGSKDADDLVKDFLDRPYKFDAFREWLEGEDQAKS